MLLRRKLRGMCDKLQYSNLTMIYSSVTINPMQLSVVHPCFNEEANVEHTVRETLAWLTHVHIDGEVIVIDDGSRDDSALILRRLSAADSRVTIVTHAENRGYGLAVRSGCDIATKEYIAFMDSDGQFRIEDLNRLIPYLHTFDFVPGRRRHRADSLIRTLLGKVLGILVVVTFGMWVRDVNCGLKVFRKSIWHTIRPLYGTEKFFNTELYLRLKRAGIPFKQVDVPHYPRRAGNPTGGSIRVIGGMFKELIDLRSKLNAEPSSERSDGTQR